MDQEVLVNEFLKLLPRLEKMSGPLTLLLLVAPDQVTTNEWNVVVSGFDLDEKSRGDAIRSMSTALRRVLKRSWWPAIKRLTVLRTDDPWVLAFRRNYSHVPPGAILHGISVSGVDIAKAVIVEAKKQAA